MSWIIIVGCCMVVAEVGLFLFAVYVIRKQHEILERFHAHRTESAPPVAPHDAVELLSKHSGEWAHHSFRPAGHRDIEEALATPGLAIRQDGVIKEGVQDE